jgi:hypothetical protein
MIPAVMVLAVVQAGQGMYWQMSRSPVALVNRSDRGRKCWIPRSWRIFERGNPGTRQ